MADFVISISYGNYLIQNGGTDKVIREHQALFAGREIDYYFLFPVVRNVKVGKIPKTFRYWGINKNKELIGLFKIDGVISYISSRAGQRSKCKCIFVHHTWRVLEEDLKAVLNIVEVPIYYYLHDFHSICDGNNLINQSGNYCGYGLNHFECSKECLYYAQSQVNRAALLSLIKEYGSRITFVAPSDNTRDIYRRTFLNYSDKFITIGHQKMQGEYTRKSYVVPIKIAFIGKQVSLKGWDDYKELIEIFGNDTDYEFYYLGTGTDIPANVKSAEVSVREQGPDAMMSTLRELEIDVVLLLSHCPETYSYTYFEAYAAACFVITYECSGNMADMVKNNHNGLVVDNKDHLISLLQDRDGLIKRMTDSFVRGSYFPLELIINDEIVRIVLKNESRCDLSETNGAHAKRQRLAELLYRLQNRTNLKKVL